MFKAAAIELWHDNCLLNDGFFSFAVVRQLSYYLMLLLNKIHVLMK